jgi:hypothetical protein
MTCPLCTDHAQVSEDPSRRQYEVECGNCGHYSIDFEGTYAARQNPAQAFFAGCWVAEQDRMGMRPHLTRAMIDEGFEREIPSVERRAELYLEAAVKSLDGKLTGMIGPASPRLRIASWSRDPNDAQALAEMMMRRGAFQKSEQTYDFKVLAEAHIELAKIAAQRATAQQAFVAMWFLPCLSTLYEDGLRPAIRGAGYDPLRVDQREHVDKIDDRIIAEIRRSSFVVADFSGQRGGVYYEAGFAHGLGKRVIFTCRKKELDRLHFDVRQYNTIPWSTPSDIIKPLQNRILALFGAGPLNRNAKPVV